MNTTKGILLMFSAMIGVTGAWAQTTGKALATNVEQQVENYATTPFNLTVGESEHGTVQFSVGGNVTTQACRDDVVTVSVTPNEGYLQKDVTVRAYTSWNVSSARAFRAPALLDDITVTKQQDGTWTFIMPEANVLVTVTYTRDSGIGGTYTLIDGELYDNASQYNGCDISYIRTFVTTDWQALYIPFSLSYDDWKDDFDVAYINGIRQWDYDDNGTIDETVMDVIKIKSGSTIANLPYLIRPKATGEKTFHVSNATLYAAEENSIDCSTTLAKYTFTGTYKAVPSAIMIANSYYGMGGGALIQSDGSNDLGSFRWYMKAEARSSSYNISNAAKIISIKVIGDEEEATGVSELRMTNDKLPVYDLNGRKVSENSLKPGLYIRNGKKFIIK